MLDRAKVQVKNTPLLFCVNREVDLRLAALQSAEGHRKIYISFLAVFLRTETALS